MKAQGSYSIQNFRSDASGVALSFAVIATVALITAIAFRNLKLTGSNSTYSYDMYTNSNKWGVSVYEYTNYTSWTSIVRINYINELSNRIALLAAMLSATASAAEFMSYHPAIEKHFA